MVRVVQPETYRITWAACSKRQAPAVLLGIKLVLESVRLHFVFLFLFSC